MRKALDKALRLDTSGTPIMISGKVTAKGRTTIPQPVRAALGLKAGDTLVYGICGKRVVLAKADDAQMAISRFRAFDEWCSEADAQAYDDL